MATRTLVDKSGIILILERLGAEIMENNPGPERLVFIGIQRRGAHIAQRLAKMLEKSCEIGVGSIDINFYRDDWSAMTGKTPHIGKSHIPFSLEDQKIILIDDVLFSGRTVRAALEALFDYGRPREVRLLAMVDRGHRQLPICAEYIGRKIYTTLEQHVDVLLEEQDGRDAIEITD